MMPFVAVTIVTAATMRRSLALTTILAIWATNQLLGCSPSAPMAQI
jgi:hypothetical protein